MDGQNLGEVDEADIGFLVRRQIHAEIGLRNACVVGHSCSPLEPLVSALRLAHRSAARNRRKGLTLGAQARTSAARSTAFSLPSSDSSFCNSASAASSAP